ncbi:unnamed protein product [Urochloa humidicola]
MMDDRMRRRNNLCYPSACNHRLREGAVVHGTSGNNVVSSVGNGEWQEKECVAAAAGLPEQSLVTAVRGCGSSREVLTR